MVRYCDSNLSNTELNNPVKSFRALLLPAALSAAVIAPVAVFAQQAGQPPAPAATQGPWQGHGRYGHRGFMGMLRGVTLSDQQKTQIRQIMQNFRRQHQQAAQADRQAWQQQREQMRQQIMNVLTPQQRTQVQQNIQQMQQQRRERREDGAAPQPSAQPEA
jgi:Spy/CpxP family protein refolding chaperone